MGTAHQSEVTVQSEYRQMVTPKDTRVNNPVLELSVSLFSKYFQTWKLTWSLQQGCVVYKQIPLLLNGQTEDQRGEVTCLKTHSQWQNWVSRMLWFLVHSSFQKVCQLLRSKTVPLPWWKCKTLAYNFSTMINGPHLTFAGRLCILWTSSGPIWSTDDSWCSTPVKKLKDWPPNV